MPATLESLLADRSLALRTVTGKRLLDRPVAWVHVSELVDPTPFLSGGELLLTTGIALDAGTDFEAFVGRLTGCGVAGLGFGVGLSHDGVPERLVDAAERAGLPLLEVPRRTPFIAISKAASAALAADAYAEVTRTNAAQRELSRAALGKRGAYGVVRRLASLLDGWVLLLDATGAVLHAAPASAASRAGRIADEVARLRSSGGPASATFELDGEWVSAQALASKPRTYLAVGKTAPFDRGDHHVVNSAAAVLTLAMARSTEQDRAQRRLRTGLLRLLLAGQLDAVRQPVADLWGPLPDAPVLVLCGAGAAPDEFAELLDAEAGGWFHAEVDEHVVLLASAQDDPGRVEAIARRLPGLRLGVSLPAEYDSLGEAHRQAVQAAEAAGRIGGTLQRFAEVAGNGLLSLLGPAEASVFAASLLGPLRSHDETGRGDLVRSLREWLRQHGQWDPAAARLGVHRHTLRNRISKAEQLIGVSLDDPSVRAELWLALRVEPAQRTPQE